MTELPQPAPDPTSSLRAYREALVRTRALPEGQRAPAVLELSRLRRPVVDRVVAKVATRAIHAETAESGAWLRFWLNHFSVFWAKEPLALALSSYVDDAVLPRIDGHFRDLLLAATIHPAMLAYLDNTTSSSGRLNENHARELLELHTMGADGGYSQADVRELARVLTGFGLRPMSPVIWPAGLQPLAREDGEFLFDPRRHDRGAKLLLGQKIEPAGFAELEQALDILCSQQATALHLSRRLCTAFIGDAAPSRSVERVAATWRESDGNLTEVRRALREAAADASGVAPTFKDPWRWVISSVRLLLGGRPVADPLPVVAWLSALGQMPFARTTPDGYPLRGEAWASPGQLAQRALMANSIVARMPAVAGRSVTDDEMLEQPGVRDALDSLGGGTRAVLDRARGARQRLALLLASPEFSHWLPEGGFA